MMWTTLLTPWYRRTAPRTGGPNTQPGSTAPTQILDHESAAIRALLSRAIDSAGADDPIAVLQRAHGLIQDGVRPVYGMEEATPTSRTLERGSGSCSQRLAVLESVARAADTQTRVRAFLVDRSFWYPRFPRLRTALPPHVVLAWPEFLLGEWRSASELFGPIGCQAGDAFTNTGSETLFEAAGRCAIDWDGDSAGSASDLSGYVRAELGYFTDRDELFARVGQTLCAPTRALADPLMRRIAA